MVGGPLRDDDAPVDDDFLYHLYRGGELLGSGDIHKAKDALERALSLRPRNQKSQNMLGLVYFKLGMFDRAAEIYGQLVRDHPLDPTLRVNLGLTELRGGRVDRAIRELQTAVDLQPDHARAHNYLGLALARVGDHARAREAFLRAGSEAMAQRMERLLAGVEPPADPSLARAELPSLGDAGATGIDELEQPFREAEQLPPSAVGADAWIAAGVGEPGARATLKGAPRPQTVPEFVRVVRLDPPRGAPFAVGADVTTVEIAGEVYARLHGLLAIEGRAEATPVFKRFRGRTTERPFGEGERRLHLLAGAGRLLLAGGSGRLFTALSLEDDQAYVAEDALAAFDGTLSFENGRVPGRGADLHLVHLRGTGQLLLATDKPVRSLAVTAEAPLRVPVPLLVGWSGGLTLRLTALADDEGGPPLAELIGDGHVLLLA